MKKIFTLALGVLLITGCSEEKGYELSGTVANPGLNGQYVYLYEYGKADKEAVDSALVTNSTFVFRGNQETPELYMLEFDITAVPLERTMPAQPSPYVATFILENAKLKVKLDQVSTVTGTSNNDAYSNFITSVANTRKAFDDYIPETIGDDNTLQETLEKKQEEVENEVTQKAKEFIEKNPANPLAAKTLVEFRYNLGEEDRRALIEQADETFVAVPGIQQMQDHLNLLSNTAIGKQFTDFEMNDPKGKAHKLSEYVGVGKPVLIDFWASWCPPCRRDMPQLVALYKEYKEKGFEIVGISLDSNQAAWDKGIQDLHITWPQLSDLQGWKNAGTALYGINLIPQTVLVDKEGIIVAKNLHGEALRDKLNKLIR
ncbi:MAG: AhpC/TSA family protein [Tannerellaceae bacterium]|nr:AhpC/TSA family protein [Tannerellaceae bacterium]